MPDINKLDDWTDIYLKECEFLRGCSPNTMRAYRKVLSLWPHYGYGLRPEGTAQVAMAMREQGLVPLTVNSYLRIIRIFWNWAHRRGLLAVAPEVLRLPEPKKVKAVFSSSQALAVLKAKPEHAAVKRAQAIFAVGIDTGLRFGELVSLRRSDMDAQSMLLTVCGKVGESAFRYLLRPYAG
jgi:site-specific recombinase XerD